MGKEIQNNLVSFYRAKFPSREDMVISHFKHISAGWENEVYSFTIGYKEAGKRFREEMILRIYPGDNAPQKAAREFNGMKKLYELGFPVPQVFVLELDNSPFGSPFVIMEKINGQLMGQAIDKSSHEKRQELITLFCKMFVHLHALDWKPFVTNPYIYETGDPYTLVNQWLSRGQRYIEDFGAKEYTPVLCWLEERRLDVPSERPSVIHFDYHLHNILLQDDGKAFVIDWTNIDIADFRIDLAWTILLTSTYGHPEAREIVLGEYERIAGSKIQHIEYFEVVACLRRLLSISVSISEGATKLGMRPQAVAMMKQNVGHIKNVYAFLFDRTGIAIPEVEKLISSLSSI